MQRVSVRNRTLMKKSPHPPTLPRQRGYPYLNADKTSRGILNNCRLTVGRLSVAESCSSVTDKVSIERICEHKISISNDTKAYVLLI